jgi:hypothetical protein
MRKHIQRCIGGLAVAFAIVACSPDRLLEVEDIDVLDPSRLNTKEALPTLLAGSLSAFQIAYSGAGDLSNGGHEGPADAHT